MHFQGWSYTFCRATEGTPCEGFAMEGFEGLVRVVVIVALIGLVATLYFTPSIVARARGSVSFGAIFVLNLLAGGSGIGWLIALLWACFGATAKPPPSAPTRMVSAQTFAKMVKQPKS
jgi:hypothetical protein